VRRRNMNRKWKIIIAGIVVVLGLIIFNAYCDHVLYKQTMAKYDRAAKIFSGGK